MPMSAPLSVRAFASKLGVSHVAVLKAIKTGRLVTSIRQNAKGHAEIVDFDIARQEWEANAGRPPKSIPPVVVTPVTNVVTTVTTTPESGTVPQPSVDDVIGEGGPLHASSLIEAQRLLTLERLRRQRLDLERDTGRLVLRTDVAKVIFESEKILRENMLNVPARISGTLAATTDPATVYQLLDAALREALQATASQYEERAAAHG